MNFLLRSPLWPPDFLDSQRIGSYKAEKVPVLDLHELAAGKLAALFSRNAGRDLFDTCNLLRDGGLDSERLRLGFVVYGGAGRRDWRTVALKDVKVNANDVANQLIPMLQRDLAPPGGQVAEWSRKLVQECRELLSGLLPLRSNEMEFIAGLNDRGEILPELLTDDKNMQSIVSMHPALQWKALNVRKYRNL